MATGSKPVRTFRYGGISASVFRNEIGSEDAPTTFHKVSLQRAFKQGDEFKHTTTFGRDDLPIAILVLQQAWQYILEADVAARSGEQSQSPATPIMAARAADTVRDSSGTDRSDSHPFV